MGRSAISEEDPIDQKPMGWVGQNMENHGNHKFLAGV